VREIAPDGVRFAFDASGAPASWTSALLSIGPGGVFGVAAPPRGSEFGVDPNVMLSKAVRIQFILGGAAIPRIFLPQLIKWYKQGRFPVDRLIKTFAFEEINVAFAEAHSGRVIKPVLLML
jgi:aryl-alcohol dehydrogenase